MWSLKGALAVHFNLPLLSFYLCTTFKTGIAAAGEPIPLEQERFGDCILELAAAVCTAIPHFSVQFVQSLAAAIEYNWEWAAAVCTAVPHLSVQFVQFVLSLDNFSVPSVLAWRDRFDQFNTALS